MVFTRKLTISILCKYHINLLVPFDEGCVYLRTVRSEAIYIGITNIYGTDNVH
jgi:hypothetical protein